VERRFLARLYKDYNKNKEAAEEYQKLIRLDYMTDSNWIDMAEVLYGLEKYREAIGIFTRIEKKRPNDPNVNLYLGMSLSRIGEYQKASTYLEKAIRLGSNVYQAFWHLGICYYYTGQFENALDAYSKALSIKPDSNELKQCIVLAHIKIGQSLLDKNLVQAEAEFRKALKVIPEHPEMIKKLENVQEIKRLRAQIAEAKALLEIKEESR
jgi:tetratricopeptide (TPR) repeat protein